MSIRQFRLFFALCSVLGLALTVTIGFVVAHFVMKAW